MKRILFSLLMLAGISGGLYAAAGHEVGQKNKKFTVDKLSVKVGETVSFPNHDPFFHNVFSLSDVATFDLGSYAQGDTRTVTFEEAGVVDVECAIHPQMRMQIEVTQ